MNSGFGIGKRVNMVKSKFVWDAEDAAGLIITPAEPDLPVSATRSLRQERERERRRALMNEPNARPLVDLVSKLRDEGRGYVPDLDPLDGGVDARIALLPIFGPPEAGITGLVYGGGLAAPSG